MSQPPPTPAESARREARAGDAAEAAGRPADAREHYLRAIALQPANVTHLCRLGGIEWRLGVPDAGGRFERATELEPRLPTAHAALSAWRLQQGDVPGADKASQRACELAPKDPQVLQSRAGVLEVLGDLDAAWRMAERLIANDKAPPLPVIAMYGRMARYRGRQDAALHLIARQLVDRRWAPRDEALLRLTAANLFDSAGNYDRAFGQARHGNALVRRPYDRHAHERNFDALIAYFTRDRLARLARSPDARKTPVLIVGMPRSGTSLVEQVLAAHPQVHGGGEREWMSDVWERALRALGADATAYPACLDRLTAAQAQSLGNTYLEKLAALSPTATFITDKLPLNFLHLGLAALLLPGARVIDCRRDPRDTCLSCFMTMFEHGNDFSQDLAACAHFHLQCRRVMDHFQAALDLPILQVHYESLVADLEGGTRRMLDFLGLPWDEGCLGFHASRRAVTTASKHQVRQPLYSSSVGRWRRYARHLAELDLWFGPAPL